MYIVIITSLIALLLTYLDSIGKVKGGMKWGFILVTFLGVIHYDYGNDYMSYYNIFQIIDITPFNFTEIIEGSIHRDPGWVLLCYCFKHIGGFFMLVAVLSIVQNTIIFRFIYNEVPPKWYPISMLVYLFTTSFFLMSFSMMRQWFVMCVFIGLWPYIKNKKWLIPLFVLVLCRYIHASAAVLIPFAFWGFLPLKRSKVTTVLFVGFIIALWLSGSWVNSLFEKTVDITETDALLQTYGKDNDTVGSFGLGALIQFIPLLVGIYYLMYVKNSNVSQKQLVLLSLLGFAISPLRLIVPAVGRLGLYFSVYQIASVPLIYGNIKNDQIKISLLGLFILIVLYDYFLFFSDPVWRAHYWSFHTIFEII